MRPCRLLLSHCKRMGMSQIHNFSFMGWRSHSPNIPCLTGVQPGASPSPDKVIKKLWKLPQDGLKHSHGQNVDFFFFLLLQAGAGARKPRKREKNAFFFFLPQSASSMAKVRARQRTHTAPKGPSYEHHDQLLWHLLTYCYFIFFCILITRSQKFLPNGKAGNQFFLQQSQFHKC